MIPMRPEGLAELLAAIGPRINPAGPELAVKVAAAARREYTDGEGPGLYSAEILPVLRRLLDAETALTTLRHLVADLVAELDDGDEITTHDVRHRLAAASVRLDDEIDAARTLHTARAATAAL
jgi:hypothetical protein